MRSVANIFFSTSCFHFVKIFTYFFIFEYILMVYTSQPIKYLVSETSLFTPFSPAFAKISFVIKIQGVGCIELKY